MYSLYITYDTQALAMYHLLYERHNTTSELPTSRQPNAAQRIPHVNKYLIKFKWLRTNSSLTLRSQ
jgi:hypothetical protein